MAGSQFRSFSKQPVTNPYHKTPDSGSKHGIGVELPPSNLGINRLHNTFGNKALQQMLKADMVHAPIQRKDSNAKPVSGTKSDSPRKHNPAALLTLTDMHGAAKFKGDCEIPGHEGKIEVISFQESVQGRSIGTSNRAADKPKKEEPPLMEIVITRYRSSLTQDLFMSAFREGSELKLKAELGSFGKEGQFTTRMVKEGVAYIEAISQHFHDDLPAETVSFSYFETKYSVNEDKSNVTTHKAR